MKFIFVFMLSIKIFTENAYAQLVFKEILTPVTGIVNLRYKLGHESKCTTKESTKKSGDLFSDTDESVIRNSITEDAVGKLKLTNSRLNIGTDFIETELLLTTNGDIIKSQVVGIKTSIKLKDDKGRVLTEAKLLSSIMGHGIDLKQGSTFIADICIIRPYADTIKASGESNVIGMATINGRQSIVLRSNQTSQCNWLNHEFSVTNKGWVAVDTLSGLLSKSSHLISIEIDGEVINGATDVACIFKPLPVNAQTTQKNLEITKTIANRLIELKELFEKNLISQEIFEQKRVEILRSL